MPTAISTEHPIMVPSFSTNTHNIKLAPTITRATVVSFEKQADQKIWYKIRVEPLSTKKYFISRKYEDFSQFSQKLYDRFSSRAGSRLPPKIKSRIQLLPLSKQVYAQRVQELNQFLSILFQKQSIVTDSFIVLEFFQSQDLFIPEEYVALDFIGDQTPTSSRWKRLRCTSFLASRSPPTGLSSKSSLGIYEPQHPLDDSTIGPTSVSHHQDKHQLKTTIKIKVIYDVDNIIVIQVPRSISLVDLRSRISQKFSDPSMGGTIQVEKELVLLFNDNSSSCCSLASTVKNDTMLPAVLINKEQDLVQIMHTKWNRLEKVTLRCIM
ncbi:hypothetical protein BDF21DRAFT_445386 [Thamnidium elegans]|nr:hypothetical protein BDF21DRAFT_445386 [Thamnidium elegans]